jgi:ribosomal protein S12 methylthiotransferase
VNKLRDRIPNLVLRTTFVVGFPGETDEQFEELKDFVAETKFQRMGAFTYSLEPGTPAVKLDGHLPEEVKVARRDELMELQQEIAFEFTDSLVGYELDVMIDQHLEGDLWLGRCYADAPEIDANVIVNGVDLKVGQKVPVVLDGRQDYDWTGTVWVDEDEQHSELSDGDGKQAPTESGSVENRNQGPASTSLPIVSN